MTEGVPMPRPKRRELQSVLDTEVVGLCASYNRSLSRKAEAERLEELRLIGAQHLIDVFGVERVILELQREHASFHDVVTALEPDRSKRLRLFDGMQHTGRTKEAMDYAEHCRRVERLSTVFSEDLAPIMRKLGHLVWGKIRTFRNVAQGLRSIARSSGFPTDNVSYKYGKLRIPEPETLIADLRAAGNSLQTLCAARVQEHDRDFILLQEAAAEFLRELDAMEARIAERESSDDVRLPKRRLPTEVKGEMDFRAFGLSRARNQINLARKKIPVALRPDDESADDASVQQEVAGEPRMEGLIAPRGDPQLLRGFVIQHITNACVLRGLHRLAIRFIDQELRPEERRGLPDNFASVAGITALERLADADPNRDSPVRRLHAYLTALIEYRDGRLEEAGSEKAAG